MSDDTEPRGNRRERKSDRENLLKKTLGNGLGLMLSRGMVIFGFPAITALAAYAANVTLEKFETSIKDVGKEIHQVAKTVEDLSLDEKDTNKTVATMRIDLTHVQDKQDAMADQIRAKR